MVDFHTHILPGIDDGSRDPAESIGMLALLREQNVTTAAATPHYYAQKEPPARFFERRQSAYEALTDAAKDRGSLPGLLLGAEVWYYAGISRMRELPSFRLQGTRLLLLELPTEPWTNYMCGELSDLSCSGDFVLMLAHIERYLRCQPRGLWDKLLEAGILMQVNTSFFLSPWTRRRALAMLEKQMIHVLGSDCHDLTLRAPRMAEAGAVIRKKLGAQAADALDSRSEALLHMTDVMES